MAVGVDCVAKGWRKRLENASTIRADGAADSAERMTGRRVFGHKFAKETG
jgi:hypothetical protein